MSKHKSGKLPPFVPLLKDTMKTPAWRALSHGAQMLYVMLKWRFNKRLENSVYLATRKAAEELGTSRETVRRWFRELEHCGFIVMVGAGCLGVEGHGKAPHWRLTEEWYLGKPPTRDFLQWDGTRFRVQRDPAHYKRLAALAENRKKNRIPTTRLGQPDNPSRPVRNVIPLKTG